MLKQLRRSVESGTALWEDHWRRFAAIRYDAPSLRWDGMLDWIDERLAAGRTLEAGCGLGRYLLYAVSRGHRAIGIDFAVDPLKRIAAHDPRAMVAAADLSHLPFAAETFDTVLCFGVLEHFETGAAAQVNELAALLRPGGWLIVTVPYASYLKRRRAAGGGPDVIEAGRPLPAGMGFYQHCFTRSEARALVSAGGLEVVAERRVSRLFWLLGRRAARRTPAASASAGAPRKADASPSPPQGLRRLARDAAYWAQWAIPPDLTSHMIVVVGRKPATAARQPRTP